MNKDDWDYLDLDTNHFGSCTPKSDTATVEIIDVDSFVFPSEPHKKLNTVGDIVKILKHGSKIKGEKENIPIHVSSLPHTPMASKKSLSSSAKKCPSPDIIDVQKLKHMHQGDSYDQLEAIKSMLEVNQTEQKIHQSKLLQQIEQSNHQYEIQVRNMQEFQTNFLAAISHLAPQN